MPGPYSVSAPVHDPDGPGRFVGDAYMRPGEVRAAAHGHGGVKTAPYKAPVIVAP